MEENNLSHDQTFSSQKSLHVKPKATAFSLPPSSSSTPPLLSSEKLENRAQNSHRFSAELPQPAMQHTLQLRRSKSCGDGRSSSPDDFDIMSKNSKNATFPHLDHDSSNSSSDIDTDLEPNPSEDESFKCGALCLFFHGMFYKKKPALKTGAEASNTEEEGEDGRSRVSKVASFERFECGSWSSAANFDHDESGPLSYFDLPLELIRCGANESGSPVRTAFVFDKDLKSVLKKKSTVSRLGSRRSCESNNGRHVRFSTSSPTSYPASPALSPCITPRLMKARDEFNALLEATSV